MCDTVSDCCTVLPISEARPVCTLCISCLREKTDSAKKKIMSCFSISTCELHIILCYLSEDHTSPREEQILVSEIVS